MQSSNVKHNKSTVDGNSLDHHRHSNNGNIHMQMTRNRNNLERLINNCIAENLN